MDTGSGGLCRLSESVFVLDRASTDHDRADFGLLVCGEFLAGFQAYPADGEVVAGFGYDPDQVECFLDRCDRVRR